MKTGIIVQARKGSTRLPRKMVLPFKENEGVLELVVNKLLKEFDKSRIVLATTKNPFDDELIEIAKKKGINYFRGDEANVLDRFIQAGEHFEFTNIIRVCADNPFLDIPHIFELKDYIEKNSVDYVSYVSDKGLPIIKSHLGLFTEAITLSALKRIQMKTKLSYYLEHVTNFIYENKDDFSLKFLSLPGYMKDTESIRLTLDTIEDFRMEKELFKSMSTMSTEKIVTIIKNDTALLKLMNIEISRHKK